MPRSGRIPLSRRPIIASPGSLPALIATRTAPTLPPCPGERPHQMSSSTLMVGPLDLVSSGFDPFGCCEPFAGRFVRPDGTFCLKWHVPESSHERIAPDTRATLDSLRIAASGKAWPCD